MLDVEFAPEWVNNYAGFKRDMPGRMLDSRVLYYPGAGDDLHPLEVFGTSGYCHCFIHADYKGGTENLASDCLPGYEIMEKVKLDYRFIVEALRLDEGDPYSRRSTKFVDLEQIKKGISYWIVFKRKLNRNEGERPKVLILLQIFGEAVGLLWNLWTRRKTNPYAILLQDHRIGGLNWTAFGGSESPLYHVAHKASLPPFLMVGEGTRPWPGYRSFKSVGRGGMHSSQRVLYQRSVTAENGRGIDETVTNNEPVIKGEGE